MGFSDVTQLLHTEQMHTNDKTSASPAAADKARSGSDGGGSEREAIMLPVNKRQHHPDLMFVVSTHQGRCI